jgi:hypothetical protein
MVDLSSNSLVGTCLGRDRTIPYISFVNASQMCMPWQLVSNYIYNTSRYDNDSKSELNYVSKPSQLSVERRSWYWTLLANASHRRIVPG